MKRNTLFLLGIAGPMSLQPCSAVDWTGAAGDDNFNTDGNWTTGAPGLGETAKFFRATEPSLFLGSDASIGLFDVNSYGGASTVALDTGGNVLTFGNADAIKLQGSVGSQLSLSGNLQFDPASGGISQIRVQSGSTLTFDGAIVNGSGPSTGLQIQGGGTMVIDSSIVGPVSSILVAGSGMTLQIDNASTLDTGLTLRLGASLSFNSQTDGLVLTGDLNTASGGGSWVFDLDDLDSDPGQGASNHSYIVAEMLDLSNVSLDVSNVPAYAAGPGHVVLATYNDSLLGTFSADNLGPGLFIDYAFGPNGNQIAIVPEASLVAPIFAGFLPFFVFRRRSRR